MATQSTTITSTSLTVSVPVTVEHRSPLNLKGVLESYKHFDVTPIIGREYPDVQLTDWLNATNADDLIRDLAITSKYLSWLSPVRPDRLRY
jgi:hypothetical protein